MKERIRKMLVCALAVCLMFSCAVAYGTGEQDTAVEGITISFDGLIEMDLPGSWHDLSDEGIDDTWMSDDIPQTFVLFSKIDAEEYTMEELEEDRDYVADQIEASVYYGEEFEVLDMHEAVYDDDVKTIVYKVHDESEGTMNYIAFIWEDDYANMLCCIIPEENSDQIDFDSMVSTVRYIK